MKTAYAGLLSALLAAPAAAEEFSFDASEFDKKAFEFGGYVEIKQEALRLRGDSVGYRLAYPGEPARETLDRSTATLELDGKWRSGDWLADFRTRSSYATDALTQSTEPGTLLDGGLRWQASDSLSLDAGKRAQRWGKGYAWNPVGFVERPKDPNDTQLAREGYYMAGGEWVKSFSGPLATLSLTPLLVPVKADVNADYGKPGYDNPALKAYALLYDTDIDLYWAAEGSKPERFGADFSRNLGADFEVHGEWARAVSATRNLLNANGTVSSSVQDQDSYLLGLRYITRREVTWIAEYYHNGSGYSASELRSFYDYADAMLPTAQATKVFNLAQSGYGRPNPGRDYFYLRASANEPFDWLYTTLALTSIVNLRDRSGQLTPEVSYTGFANVELRARVIFLRGGADTEFGQKSTGRRIEAYARFYF